MGLTSVYSDPTPKQEKNGQCLSVSQQLDGVTTLVAQESSPPKKRRFYNQLDDIKRGQIEVLAHSGLSGQKIAEAIGCSRSTISREFKKRSIGDDFKIRRENYQASVACRGRQLTKQNSRKKGKHSEEMKIEIEKEMKFSRSPKQMVHVNKKITVCCATIYRWINCGLIFSSFDEAKKYLRKKGKKKKNTKKNKYENVSTVHERGDEILSKENFGHWECDSIISAGTTKRCMMTFYERKTQYGEAFFADGCTADNFYNKLKYLLKKFPKGTIKSITVDRGSEFARYADIEGQLGVKVYFADPHSPWQKGGVENFNGLLRNYYEKKTSFALEPWQGLNNKALVEINSRPRESRNWKMPALSFQREVNILKSQANHIKRCTSN